MGKRKPNRHVASHAVRLSEAKEKHVLPEEIQDETVKNMAYHAWKHLVSMLTSFVLFAALGALALVSDTALAWAQTHWPHVPHWKYLVWELADDGLFILDVVNILYSIGKKLFK
jgi:hypothetical protein